MCHTLFTNMKVIYIHKYVFCPKEILEKQKYRQGISTNMSSIKDGESSLSWKKIDYDFFLTKLGEFGWFQKKALFWLWLPAFVGGIVSVFIQTV